MTVRRKECQTTLHLLCLQQQYTNSFGMLSAYIFAGKYGGRELDVTRSFLRQLRFNSRDMTTILESGAGKLNGQAEANGESVPQTVILKFCAHRGCSHIFNSVSNAILFHFVSPGYSTQYLYLYPGRPGHIYEKQGKTQEDIGPKTIQIYQQQ